MLSRREKRDIIIKLLLNHTGGLYISQAAKLLNVGIGLSKSMLDAAYDDGWLKKYKIGTLHLYKLNEEKYNEKNQYGDKR